MHSFDRLTILISALFFFYLLLKVGLLQCITRSLCKMTWAGCGAYCHAMKDISSFIWFEVKNAKRVRRGRRRPYLDLEKGSSTPHKHEPYENSGSIRERLSFKHRRSNIGGRRQSLHSVMHVSKKRSYSGSHHIRLRRKELSMHRMRSGRLRNARGHRMRHFGY